MLAYSSSRIHVIDVTGPEVEVQRELKILRRPASVSITDDGGLLSVLSTDLQIDLYNMSTKPPRHTRVVTLDHGPRTIALSPTGSVLAAAYDSGIEVSSLEPECVNNQRRAVKCYGVDSLRFSKDGRQLLGTTSQSRNSSTVVLAAPYYDPVSSLPEESVSALWTTSILFPNGSRDCSHAVLLPNPSDEEPNWAFTYDRIFETFRAVRIEDLRNGTTYFTGPTASTTTSSKLIPSTLPAASSCGDLVAAGFQGAIWLYGVPEDLEAIPFNNGANSNIESEPGTPLSHVSLNRRNSAPSLRSGHRRERSYSRIPQWQLLCDRFRNNLVEGKKIASFTGTRSMTWVNDSTFKIRGERLVLVAPGVRHTSEGEADGMDPVDGGRMCLLDFGHSTCDGDQVTVTIEVGMKEPEVLEEEHRDIDTEVAIVRRRTVAQKQNNRRSVTRSATTSARPMTVGDASSLFRSPLSASVLPPMPSLPSPTASDRAETTSIGEDQEAFDTPYSHTSPRSGTTLRRAATAAAINRRLHPRSVASEHIEYRRADGREEHPHESDADNWVPPPPPYSKDAVPPLPEHIQRSILAENARNALQRSSTQRAPSLNFPGLDAPPLSRTRTTSWCPQTEARRDQRLQFRRSFNDIRGNAWESSAMDHAISRRSSSKVSPEFDELYDATPPSTPRPSPGRLHVPRTMSTGSAHLSVASSTQSSVSQVTTDQPVSPTPDPVSNASGSVILDWDTTSSFDHAAPPSPVSIMSPEDYMVQDASPERSHRLTMPPSHIPPFVLAPDNVSAQDSASQRSNFMTSHLSVSSDSNESVRTVNESSSQPDRLSAEQQDARPATSESAVSSVQPEMSRPSAEQLARLQSRKGRPPERLLTGPRRSGSFPELVKPSTGSSNRGSFESLSRPRSMHRPNPPRVLSGVSDTSSTGLSPVQQSPGIIYSAYAETSAQLPQVAYPSSRMSIGNSFSRGSPTPSRPPMSRLDTIHSINAGEDATNSGGIDRRASRAKKNAMQNVQDSKKKGWRRSMSIRKPGGKTRGKTKEIPFDYSGWTHVAQQEEPKEAKKAGTKCVVM